jgi:hypothetical protein
VLFQPGVGSPISLAPYKRRCPGPPSDSLTTAGKWFERKVTELKAALSLETMTPEQRSERARKAVAAREAKRKATSLPDARP